MCVFLLVLCLFFGGGFGVSGFVLEWFWFFVCLLGVFVWVVFLALLLPVSFSL